MSKILVTMASAMAILLAGQAVANAGPYDCAGAAPAVANSTPHAAPDSGMAAAPAAGQRYSVAPAPRYYRSAPAQAALVVPYGRSYSYAPSSFPPGFTAYEDSAAAAYSPMAAVRPGQTMFTFGQRPAAAKALGNY